MNDPLDDIIDSAMQTARGGAATRDPLDDIIDSAMAQARPALAPFWSGANRPAVPGASYNQPVMGPPAPVRAPLTPGNFDQYPGYQPMPLPPDARPPSSGDILGGDIDRASGMGLRIAGGLAQYLPNFVQNPAMPGVTPDMIGRGLASFGEQMQRDSQPQPSMPTNFQRALGGGPSLVMSVAPVVAAGALGGPLAGAAVGGLMQAGGTTADVRETLEAKGDPNARIKAIGAGSASGLGGAAINYLPIARALGPAAGAIMPGIQARIANIAARYGPAAAENALSGLGESVVDQMARIAAGAQDQFDDGVAFDSAMIEGVIGVGLRGVADLGSKLSPQGVPNGQVPQADPNRVPLGPPRLATGEGERAGGNPQPLAEAVARGVEGAQRPAAGEGGAPVTGDVGGQRPRPDQVPGAAEGVSGTPRKTTPISDDRGSSLDPRPKSPPAEAAPKSTDPARAKQQSFNDVSQKGMALTVDRAVNVWRDGIPAGGRTRVDAAKELRESGQDVVYASFRGEFKRGAQTGVDRLNEIAARAGYAVGEPVPRVEQGYPFDNQFVVELLKADPSDVTFQGGKKPWQMSGAAYVVAMHPELAKMQRSQGTGGKDVPRITGKAIAEHRRIVEKALGQGKVVPPEVLADYPDANAPAGVTRPANGGPLTGWQIQDNLNVSIKHAAGRPGWEIDHRSDSGSAYMKHTASGEIVRLSDHGVPEDGSGRASRQPWSHDLIARSGDVRAEFDRAASEVEREAEGGPTAEERVEEKAKSLRDNAYRDGKNDAAFRKPMSKKRRTADEKRSYREGYEFQSGVNSRGVDATAANAAPRGGSELASAANYARGTVGVPITPERKAMVDRVMAAPDRAAVVEIIGEEATARYYRLLVGGTAKPISVIKAMRWDDEASSAAADPAPGAAEGLSVAESPPLTASLIEKGRADAAAGDLPDYEGLSREQRQAYREGYIAGKTAPTPPPAAQETPPGAGQTESPPSPARTVAKSADPSGKPADIVAAAQRQHAAFKKANPDVTLMTRIGDFYEMFGADAEHASKTLGLTLTSRGGVPMVGVPHSTVEKYVRKLVASGRRVAMAEQVGPEQAKGQEVDRVVTEERMVEAPTPPPAPAARAKEPAAKQAWEMTRAEYRDGHPQEATAAARFLKREYSGKSVSVRVNSRGTGYVATVDGKTAAGATVASTVQDWIDAHGGTSSHREQVRIATLEGLPVPSEVLADYPDLKTKEPPRAEPEPAKEPEPVTETRVQPDASRPDAQGAAEPVAKSQPTVELTTGTGENVNELDPTNEADAAAILTILNDKWKEIPPNLSPQTLTTVATAIKTNDAARRAKMVPVEIKKDSPSPGVTLFHGKARRQTATVRAWAEPGKEAEMVAALQKASDSGNKKTPGIGAVKGLSTARGPQAGGKLPATAAKTTQEKIKSITEFAAKENSRYAINGYLVANGGARLAATDGDRLAMLDGTPGEFGKDGLYGQDGKAMDGGFPPHEALIPKTTREVFVGAVDTLDHLRQASVFDPGDYQIGAVVMVLNKDGTLGFASQSDAGQVEANVRPGFEVIGAYNARFLGDAIRFLARNDASMSRSSDSGAKPVQIQWISSTKPIIVSGGNGNVAKVVMMPINLGKDSELIANLQAEYADTSVPPPAIGSKLLDAADKAEKAARARIAKRPGVPRGRNTGGSIIGPELADRAMIVAAKVIKAGVRTAQAIEKAFLEMQAELGTKFDNNSARKIKFEAQKILARAHAGLKRETTAQMVDRLTSKAKKPEAPKEAKNSWDMRGADLGNVFHGGKTIVGEIDPSKLNKRDPGFYGKGFYTTKNSRFAGSYGPKISEFSVDPDARVLMASTMPADAPAGLVDAVKAWTFEAGREAAEKRGKLEGLRQEVDLIDRSAPAAWSRAVDKYAEAHGYDIVIHNDGEVVIKNPKVLKSVNSVPVPAPKPAPKPAAKEPEQTNTVEHDPDQTSARMGWINADRRDILGLPETENPGVRTHAMVLDRAKEMIKAEPDMAMRLVRELEAKPDLISDVETAVMAIKWEELGQEHAKLMKSGEGITDPDAIAELASKIEHVQGQMIPLSEQMRKSGSEIARALKARQLTIDNDLSLVTVRVRATIAKGDKITAEETAHFDKLSKDLADVEQEIEANKERYVNATLDAMIEDMKREVAAPPPPPPKITTPAAKPKIVDKFVLSLNEAAEAARARIKARTSKLYSGIAPDPTALADEIIIGASHIANGIVKGSAWAGKMVSEFGAGIKPYLRTIYGEAYKKATGQAAAADAIPGAKTTKEKMSARVEDGADVAELGAYINEMALELVRSGVTKRDALLDALHKEVKEAFPKITKKQVRDILSGYGKFMPLDKEAAKVRLREIKSESQKLAQLEALVAKKAPLATGFERQAPSAEARALTKQVNEAKKKAGILPGGAGRLKTLLEITKNRLRNQISDMQAEIDTGKRIVRGKSVPLSDPELATLKQTVADLRKLHDAAFKAPKLTDEQKRANAALAAAKRAAEEWERRLQEAKNGRFENNPKNPPVSTAEITALKARAEAARIRVAEFKDADPAQQAEKEADWIQGYRTRLAEQTADLHQQLAANEFKQTAARRGMPKTAEIERLAYLRDRARSKIRRAIANIKPKGPLQKGMQATKEVVGFSRQVLTSLFDVSAIGRQGIFAAAGHPVMAGKAIATMTREMLSRVKAHANYEKAMNSENAPLYKRAKLYLASMDHSTLTSKEEGYQTNITESISELGKERGEWVSKIAAPVRAVGHVMTAAERAHNGFLNSMRVQMFDQFVYVNGKSQESIEAAANYINLATGRGKLYGFERSGDTLAKVLFSPRLMMSRLELLAGEPIAFAKGKDAKFMVMREYARTMIGFSVMAGLATLAGGEFVEDSRKTDFGMMKFGDMRVDFFGGLPKYIRGMARLITRVKINADGKEKDLTGYDTAHEFYGMFRSKASPIAGSLLDLLYTGEDYADFGDKEERVATVKEELQQLFTPITFSDAKNLFEKEGLDTATAGTIFNLLGFSSKSYAD